MGRAKGGGICVLWIRLVFSSPEQHSGRAIVLPPASALALASASTNVKVFVKVLRPHYFLTLPPI